MASALVARVARTIRRDCLVGLDRGHPDRVVVAVSGGSDSVALTWLLHALAPESAFELTALVHINHRLRGADSDADEAFCRALAARLDLPIIVAGVDVATLARARRVSVEVVARETRYAVFDEAIASVNGTVVATGHTMDDQAETVMMRMLRGAGTRGLSGIRARRGKIARPLLECRRADLRGYLEARGEPWREDQSNADRAIPRNRVRHELMPVLEAVAPGGVRAIARLAALAKDDESALMDAAIKYRAALVLSEQGSAVLEVHATALRALPPALARRLVRAFAAELAPEAHWSARHLEAVCRLAATDKPVGHLDLPGVTVERRSSKLVLARVDPAASRAADSPWPHRVLDVPGAVLLPEAGLEIEARLTNGAAGAPWMGQRAAGAGTELDADGLSLTASLQARSVRLPLEVRNRRPGDRFRPLGAPGRRKLQDVLVDRKVPRSQRDRVPVIVDADDRIVWVAGVAVAHDCRVTAPEDGVLILIQRQQREKRASQ